MRRSLKDKRNELDFEFFKNELTELCTLEDHGEIDLFFFDETAVNLTPSIPYAWQQKGKRVLLPTAKSKNMSLLGFINRANDLFPFMFEGAVNKEVIVACMDEFCKTINKKTIVILDNATPHTSLLVKEKRKEWEKKNLFLQFIPPYCPELNLIELLWKQIKYVWLKPDDYQSLEILWDRVEQILKAVGAKYTITFK